MANRHVLQLLVKILDTSLWIINKFFLHPIITRLGDKNIKTIIFYLRWRNFNGLIEEVSDIAPNLYFDILAYNGGWWSLKNMSTTHHTEFVFFNWRSIIS